MADICVAEDKRLCDEGRTAVIDLPKRVEPETAAGEFEVSIDQERLDLEMIHDFLANRSYWARNLDFETMKKMFENSVCFGVYHQEKQVGFARVVTDFVTIAYIGDVFILEDYRGKGLGKLLTSSIISHPTLKDVRLWFLSTRDAQGLYRKFGFKNLDTPERFMVRPNPETYRKNQ